MNKIAKLTSTKAGWVLETEAGVFRPTDSGEVLAGAVWSLGLEAVFADYLRVSAANYLTLHAQAVCRALSARGDSTQLQLSTETAYSYASAAGDLAPNFETSEHLLACYAERTKRVFQGSVLPSA